MRKLSRNSAEILEQMNRLAKYYLPSWTYTEGGQISALAKLFSEMTEENRRLLPVISERHYRMYLSMFGMEREGAQPAYGYIRVIPTADNTVYLKKGTRLASERAEYTTMSDLYAVGARVKAVFSSNHKGLWRTDESLFDMRGESISKTYLCFCAGNLLLSEGEFKCRCALFDVSRADQHKNAPPAQLNPAKIRWEYLTRDGFKPVSGFTYSEGQFELSFSESVPLCEFEGREGRWLRVVFEDERIMPAVSLKTLELYPETKKIPPRSMYFNDEMLPQDDFFPFSAEPTEYDAFYIRSDECFSKSGSTVTLTADISFEDVGGEAAEEIEMHWKNVIPASKLQPKPPLIKYVESVLWEYWNGLGWSRLYRDDSNTSVFVGDDTKPLNISFTCPEDIAPTSVGADEGLFLRCRIRRITAGYSDKMIYRLPKISGLSVSYSYEGGLCADRAFLCHRAELTELSSAEHYIRRSEMLSRSYSYLCLDKPLPIGYSNAFFCLPSSRFDGRGLSWEAFCQHGSETEWKEINVSDRTSGLTESGIITFGITEKMAQTRLFGEEGSWLRASVSDESAHCPLDGILFDVVAVTQRAEMPQMTFTYLGEPLKLAEGGVVSAMVSVLSDGEWRELDESKYTLEKREGRIAFDRGFVPAYSNEPNVRVRYYVTRGAEGNAAAEEIDRFLDPVPFVDRVYNPEPSFGGRDSETDSECAKRGAQKLRSLDRCISAEDYVTAVKFADSAVKKARCFRERNGALTLVLLTEDFDSNAFRLTERKVKQRVLDSMPFYMRDKLTVKHADYVELLVNATVISDGEAYPQTIHADISARLREYISPLRGGVSGKGFDIGSYPNTEMIRGVVLGTNHVVEVASLTVMCRCENRMFDLERLAEYPHGVPIAGEPVIQIREKNILI